MKYLTAPLSLAAAISLNVGLAVAADLSTLAGPAVVTSSPVLSGIDAAALRLNATDLAFHSEQEFVARFGEHATRIGEGHWRGAVPGSCGKPGACHFRCVDRASPQAGGTVPPGG